MSAAKKNPDTPPVRTTKLELFSAQGFGECGNGPAWTFVMLARMRGWDVGDPVNNGFGYYHVAVYSKGEDV